MLNDVFGRVMRVELHEGAHTERRVGAGKFVGAAEGSRQRHVGRSDHGFHHGLRRFPILPRLKPGDLRLQLDKPLLELAQRLGPCRIGQHCRPEQHRTAEEHPSQFARPACRQHL
jgi:hypothetical protein